MSESKSKSKYSQKTFDYANTTLRLNEKELGVHPNN